ncbi:hypothetical protein [Nocardia seriolae]|uniref:Uncharacterized protein n=2 Tax=Nocardia seriolae TaxID=37332 RepID=A0ABC9Z6D2_9NOCA|nr:hypothetical protein [Nocardia seriolae]QOW33332.1 hypothetical protein IMZ23_37055 [Nocardia seriolae]QUN20920.1 hypothetical protein KEC46_17775 [Nocardia seriolae]WNJ60452.1 hypothetical protein RMO66_06700 [Nocardia seriolae]BEK98647.1 hypothetical protein NSER024013_65530 [Nocardia seriolae]GAM51439.1 hypothetical protein NS07_v2contig00260-0002 [Nocardia seriolae]
MRSRKFAEATAIAVAAFTAIATGVADAEPVISYDSSLNEGYIPTGQLLADSGFRPDKDGFGFQNYGNENGPTNLIPPSMRILFGDEVCAFDQGGTCVLIPQARRWMLSQNNDMNGGHCYGMSVTSLLLHMGALQPENFGGDATADLRFPGNKAMQEMIARQFVGQSMQAVRDGQVQGTPNQIVDKLIGVLKPGAAETYSLGFYKRDRTGGHEVTPFAIEDKGDGMKSILIYDNNYLNEIRHVDVDTTRNTWTYTTAADPRHAAENYDGDAGTGTLELDPTTPAQKQHPFPHTAHHIKGNKTGASTGGSPITVFLNGDPIDHGHLLITDDHERRIGFVGGKRVNEIPGARFVDIKANDSAYRSEPTYELPPGAQYSVTVDGTELNKTDPTSVSIIGDAYEISASSINLTPNSKSTIKVSGDGSKVTYNSTDAQKPDIEIGESYDSTDYTFIASKTAVGAGGEVSVSLPLDHNVFTVDGSKSGADEAIGVRIIRDDKSKKETREFTYDGINVAKGGTAELNFDDWDKGGKSIDLAVNGEKVRLAAN